MSTSRVAYAVIAWLLLQAASILFPTFEAPPWVMKVFVTVIAAGFPIALIIAWAFEMTPEGMKRTENVSPNEYIPQWSARKFAALIVTIAMLATGLLVFQLVRSKSTSPAQVTAASTPAQKSIAVLPLLNESGDPGDEYFSDGLSEELIAALAQIKELKVIGRSSSFRFKDKKEESKTIGEKLGVSTLLEGTVRKQGTRCGSSPNWLMPRTEASCGRGPSIVNLRTSSRSRPKSRRPLPRHWS